jgi:hypothetical protein
MQGITIFLIEPGATITNCMSREAGWSPENTSSVTELLNPGIIYQPSQSTSNPTILFIPFSNAVDLTKLHRPD